MPAAPSRPCKQPVCSGFAEAGSPWCTKHQGRGVAAVAATRAALDERRGSAASRGYGGHWPATAKRFRQKFPLSPGYLTRTPYWTHALAGMFHTLRESAVASGCYLEFMRALSGDVDHSAAGPAGAGVRFLAQFPIYEFHPSPSIEPSECVDHIVPVAGPADPLFYDEANHQPISNRQHSEKTATYDGGFRGRQGAAVSLSHRSPASYSSHGPGGIV